MTKTKHSLIMSAIALLVCFSMLIGTTFAWFTDTVVSSGNIIKSGTLVVTLEYSDKALDVTSTDWLDASKEVIFNYDKWEPGYTAVKYVKIENEGSLDLKFILNIIPNKSADAVNLADVIEVYMIKDAVAVDRDALSTTSPNYVGTLTSLMNETDGAAHGVLYSDEGKGNVYEIYTIALKMSESADNDYQNKSVGDGFSVQLLATQLTSENDSFDDQYDKDSEYEKIVTTDTWDGTANFALFGLPREASADDIAGATLTEKEYIISTAEELVAFAKLVDAGKNFKDKTIKLNSNIDLYIEDENGEPICFDPIGSYRKDKIFNGTFDGQGHTIKNMSQNTWALDNGYYYGDLGLGLFGAIENATVKNLVMDNASISGESALCGTIAAVAGDNVIFENIKVINSEVADYQYYAGGIVGWAGGNEQFINCVIDASTTIGAQWGEFNNANGGVIGGVSTSAKILIKNCTVACRIDGFNDVTSAYEWYSYRRSGMLIGDSGQKDDPDGDNVGNAIAPNLTCENVTVIYGDWANYHYCQFKGMSYPWVRVEAGTSTGAYSNPRYGNPTDANGNEVVGENHVHNDGEKHNELIVFDQLYGGATGDRYCTYGTATHDGVTVIYNNK